MINFKEEQHDELRKISSVIIQNGVLTIPSEHLSYADYFDSKLPAKIYPSDQSFEQPVEELPPLAKSDIYNIHNDIKDTTGKHTKNHSEMKSIKEHMAAMLENIHDKYDKKIVKQIQPISLQIRDISSKMSNQSRLLLTY